MSKKSPVTLTLEEYEIVEAEVTVTNADTPVFEILPLMVTLRAVSIVCTDDRLQFIISISFIHDRIVGIKINEYIIWHTGL